MTDAFSHGFFGDNPDKDSVDTVLSRYNHSKNPHITNHTLEHYELYANSHNKAALTSHQLLYYHVYGDYRLTLDENDKPRFSYRTRHDTEIRPTLIGNNGLCHNRRNQYFLNPHLEHEREDIISGIYNEVTNDGGLRYDIGSVDWLNMEMKKQGTGSLFNLPSLGTQIVKLHSYGNASDGIKKALVGELEELVEYYEANNGYNHPDVFFDQTTDELLDLLNETSDGNPLPIARRITEDTLNEDIPGLLAVFVTSFLSNVEYRTLSEHTQATKLPDGDNIRRELRRVYLDENGFDMFEANSTLVNALFANTAQAFEIGERVTLRNVSGDVLDKIAVQFGIDEGSATLNREEVKNSSYTVQSYEGGNEDGRFNGYTLAAVDLVSGSSVEVFNDDWWYDSEWADDPKHMFKADKLVKEEMTLDLQGSGDVGYGAGGKKKKGKKQKGGGKTLDPILILFQRILLDTFCAIQILCELSSEYNDTQPKGEAKIRFLSSGVNVYSSTTGKKEGNKKKTLKMNDVYHTFPNMTTFNRTGIGNTEPGKNEKLGNVGYLDKLAKWRTYYTLSILAQIRKKTVDRQHMDDFYSNNMLVKEVEWLSSALGDGAKVLRKKEDPTDLLSQVQYTYVRGVPRDDDDRPLLQQTAEAPKTTVFYEVDMPLIKEVIATYIDTYNQTVLRRAFNVPTETASTKIPASDDDGPVASEEVIRILKMAKQARTDGKNKEKSRLVGQAMRMQPTQFSVDEPYGKGKTTPEEQDSYPGVSYVPTGHKFQFHVDAEDIPEDIRGARRDPNDPDRYPGIASEDRQGRPINLGAPVDATGIVAPERVVLREKKKKEAPKQAQLATSIWNSIRDRSQGVFDIEGVKPHEFMEHLFNQMDAQLDRSNIIKSPYPEAWLGTNIVERLRNDPNRLGEVIEKQYYAEKMKEYVDALRGKYMKNYLVPSTLLTTIEQAKIKYAKDPVALKTAFMDRIAKDAASPQLVTTDYILRPYTITIAIMRATMTIPEGERDAYVAGKIDDTMREDIRRQMYHNLITPILPDTHPLYEPKPEIPRDEEESEEESQETPDPLSGLAQNIAEGIVSGFQQAAEGDQPDEEQVQDADFEVVDEDYGDEFWEGGEGLQLEANQRALPMPEEPEEELIEEIPAPPEMEVDQLDANWEEINPVIPEPDDIEEFEEEGNPADNPKGVFDDKWMYYDREHRSGDGQLRVKMDDGEIVQYKFHIALDPSDYMERTRNIVSTFLNRNKIHYKCGGSKGNQGWRTPGDTQYGKMFTLYVENHKEAITVAKGMVLLAAKHNLKGITFDPKDESNMTYERAVPGTNNTLYYTVEKASAGAVVKAGMKAGTLEQHDGRIWEMQGKGERRRRFRAIVPYLEREKGPPKGAKARPGWKPPKLSYLGPSLYHYRSKVMDYYWGQGPIDGLPIWGDKPPSKPDKPKPPSKPPQQSKGFEKEDVEGFLKYFKDTEFQDKVKIDIDEGGYAHLLVDDKEIVPPPKNDPINWNLHAYNPGISRWENDAEARKAGAPVPHCKKCGDYHDPRLECPVKVKIASFTQRKTIHRPQTRQRAMNPGGIKDE